MSKRKYVCPITKVIRAQQDDDELDQTVGATPSHADADCASAESTEGTFEQSATPEPSVPSATVDRVAKSSIRKVTKVIRYQPDDDDARDGETVPQNAEAVCASDVSQEEVAPRTIIPEGSERPDSPGRRDDDDMDDDPLIEHYEAQMARADARRRADDDDDEPPFFPLQSQLAPATPFPDDALPPQMAEWAYAVTILTRGTYTVAAMMLVAMVNLILQGHANIMLWGYPRPLTLFTVIMASSGSKKSAIFRHLVAPVNSFVRSLIREEKDATEKNRRAIIVQDPTAASILNDLPKSRMGLMGLFLDEASLFLGSYSLRNENSLGMIGLMSKLWDGDPIVTSRRSSGMDVVDQKRYSIMLASPREPFMSLIANQLVRQQGFLSRLLMAGPATEKRGKASAEELAAAERALRIYRKFMYELLERELPFVEDTLNDLDPPVLNLTPEADAVLEDFGVEVDDFRESLPEGDPIHDLVNKHVEIAGRAAGTFELLGNIEARSIGVASAKCGVAFARYCMKESMRLTTPAVASPHAELAERIARWMVKKGVDRVERTDLQRASLGRKPTVAEFDPALKLLITSGWLVEETTKRKSGGRSKHVYVLTRAAKRELTRKDK